MPTFFTPEYLKALAALIEKYWKERFGKQPTSLHIYTMIAWAVMFGGPAGTFSQPGDGKFTYIDNRNPGRLESEDQAKPCGDGSVLQQRSPWGDDVIANQCLNFYETLEDGVEDWFDWLQGPGEDMLDAFGQSDAGKIIDLALQRGYGGDVSFDGRRWEDGVEKLIVAARMSALTMNDPQASLVTLQVRTVPSYYTELMDQGPLEYKRIGQMLFNVTLWDAAVKWNKANMTAVLALIAAVSGNGYYIEGPSQTFNLGASPGSPATPEAGGCKVGNMLVKRYNLCVEKFPTLRNGAQNFMLRLWARPKARDAVMAGDLNKLAEAIISEQWVGPITATDKELADYWVKVRDSLRANAAEAYKMTEGGEMPADLLPDSGYKPDFVLAAGGNGKTPSGGDGKTPSGGDGTTPSGGDGTTPSGGDSDVIYANLPGRNEKSSANVEPKADEGMSTTTMILIGAALVAGGALAYSAWTSQPKSGGYA
jgi:hypothetical protein